MITENLSESGFYSEISKITNEIDSIKTSYDANSLITRLDILCDKYKDVFGGNFGKQIIRDKNQSVRSQIQVHAKMRGIQIKGR